MKEKACLGKRNYTRREVWNSRRLHKSKQQANAISSYVALICDLVYQEPTSYEEAIQKKEWVEAMTKEYQSK